MSTNRSSVIVVLFLAVLAALFFYVNGRIDQVEAANKPVATPIIGAQTSLQANVRPAAFPTPASGNATAIIVFGQMLDFDDNKAPHIASPQSMTIASNPFEAFPFSRPFNAICTTYNGSTMYECVLTPTGATWGAFGTVAARFKATAASGDVNVALINFQINP